MAGALAVQIRNLDSTIESFAVLGTTDTRRTGSVAQEAMRLLDASGEDHLRCMLENRTITVVKGDSGRVYVVEYLRGDALAKSLLRAVRRADRLVGHG